VQLSEHSPISTVAHGWYAQGANDCLERLLSEMSYYVLSET